MPGENIYRKIRYAIALFLGTFIANTFISCEKEVHVNLASTPPQLVVQGEIEPGLPPVVLLTHTISYFSNVDLTTLQNSFIHDATVRVVTGSDTAALKEYSIDTGTNNKFYFFSLDTTGGLNNTFIGQVGKSYTLLIEYNGNSYSSVTKIPSVKMVDSLWADVPQFTDASTPPTAKELYFNYTDPDTLGNYVRFFTKRNSQPYYPGDEVYTDEVINGTTIRDIGFDLGYDHTKDVNVDSARYAFPGDTITLKWCMIDKGVYTFWNTEQFAERSAGNPFSSPINVISNIKGGALGVWAGYSPAYETIIVH